MESEFSVRIPQGVGCDRFLLLPILRGREKSFNEKNAGVSRTALPAV
jgi:hypothetical protein